MGLPVEREIADRLAERFLSIVRATVKGTLVVGIVQGILGGLTFWIVGIPSAALFGVLMGLFSLIPAVGQQSSGSRRRSGFWRAGMCGRAWW
jgi:predicted PurR-regulated permease PerM